MNNQVTLAVHNTGHDGLHHLAYSCGVLLVVGQIHLTHSSQIKVAVWWGDRPACVFISSYRDVVAHKVPVALLGVELDAEASHIPQTLRRAGWMNHGGQASSYRSLLANTAQEVSTADVADVMGDLEVTLGNHASRMHGALRNLLTVQLQAKG